MSPADFERIVDVFEHDLVAIVAGLQAANFCQAYQGIAMDAVKAIGELGFEIFEWILDQHFAFAMAYGDIFLIGLKIIDIVDRYQDQVAAHPRTDMLACFDSR